MAKELSDYKASLSDEEIKKLIEDTEHLKKYQEEPSSDEDLRKLPMLTRADMKKNAMPFSNIEDELLDVKVVRHDIESNGIDYISFYLMQVILPRVSLAILASLQTHSGW